MAAAGQSARAEYDRRRTRDRDIIRRNLKFTVPLIVFTPVVVYFAVRLGVNLFNHFVHSSIAASTHQPTTGKYKHAVDGSVANDLAVLLAVVATISLAGDFWGRRRTTEAWRIGAEGEERLGLALDALEDHGYHVFHDLGIPRSKANIDHLVIGPTGVFVIDSKNYSGTLTWSKNTLWHGRFPLTKKLSTIRWEAGKVIQALGEEEVPIRAMMCVLGASTPKSWMVVDEVTVVRGPARLIKGILDSPAVADPVVLARIASLVETAFPAHA